MDGGIGRKDTIRGLSSVTATIGVAGVVLKVQIFRGLGSSDAIVSQSVPGNFFPLVAIGALAGRAQSQPLNAASNSILKS
jgi:hypothetical protein